MHISPLLIIVLIIRIFIGIWSARCHGNDGLILIQIKNRKIYLGYENSNKGKENHE